MGSFRVKVRITGINEVRMALGQRAASDLADSLDLLMGVEVRKVAHDAAARAPVDTGALKASIKSSTRRVGEMSYIIGSYMPYAQWQNYRHKTKNYYFEKAIWAAMPVIEDEIVNLVRLKLR